MVATAWEQKDVTFDGATYSYHVEHSFVNQSDATVQTINYAAESMISKVQSANAYQVNW